MQTFVGVAGLLGSLILVAITAWYAWQTQQMVREMKAARLAGLRPDVRLDAKVFGASVMTQIENVGVGPAIDIFVDVIAEVDGTTVAQTAWHTPILRPGESRILDFPQHDGSLYQFKQLVDAGSRITLGGRCSDLTGQTVELSSVLKFDATTKRDFEVVVHSPDHDLVTQVKAIAKELSGLRDALGRLSSRG